MTKTPKFSVLLPTRNRSHVVHHAIHSVLNQTVRDLELVISDNSSNDETAKLVAGISDERIQYFRTERMLGMPDNFENSLSKSRGEWITLLPDDCALSSRAFEIIESALQACPSDLAVWDWWHYYPENAQEPGRRNQYVQRPFSGAIRYEKSSDSLGNLFRMTHGRTLPRPYQSCVKRTLMDELRARVGRAFPPPAPDYTFLMAILALTKQFTFIDLPLMLSNAGDTSPHASPAAFSRFLDELGEAKKGGWMPIKIPVIHPTTILVESMCRMQATMPELAGYELDLVNYLVDFKNLLTVYRQDGYPVAFEQGKFDEFIAEVPLATRLKVELAYTKLVAKEEVKKQLKRVVLKVPTLERLAGMAANRLVIRGERESFRDIEGAMRHLEATFRIVAPRAPNAA